MERGCSRKHAFRVGTCQARTFGIRTPSPQENGREEGPKDIPCRCQNEMVPSLLHYFRSKKSKPDGSQGEFSLMTTKGSPPRQSVTVSTIQRTFSLKAHLTSICIHLAASVDTERISWGIVPAPSVRYVRRLTPRVRTPSRGVRWGTFQSMTTTE